MTTKYAVERYEGEQAVVGRHHGIICETYLCGDLSRREASDMARELTRLERDRERAEHEGRD